MCSPRFVVILLIFTAFASPAGANSYCVSIAPEARSGERVSALDLVLEHATLVSIPKYPVGWQLDIRQEVEGDTVISGAALAGVAELLPRELGCLFEVRRSFNERAIPMTGRGTVSFGIDPQRQVVLRSEQIRFVKSGGK
jgi:hypothetical protein